MADRLMPGMKKVGASINDGPSRAAKKFAKTSAAKPRKSRVMKESDYWDAPPKAAYAAPKKMAARKMPARKK